MHASAYASSHVRYRECDVKEPNDEKLELQMWLVDLISWNQKPVPTQIQLLLFLCSVSQCNFNFSSYPQQIFSTLYFLTSTYFSAGIWLQICCIYEGFFIKRSVLYIACY